MGASKGHKSPKLQVKAFQGLPLLLEQMIFISWTCVSYLGMGHASLMILWGVLTESIHAKHLYWAWHLDVLKKC